MERTFEVLRYEPGQRGLTNTRRPPKDHAREHATNKRFTQYTLRPNKMFLAYHLFQGAGSKSFGEWLGAGHGRFGGEK
jgi:hypothetical protein